jgi:hypothetical protein
MKWSDVVNCISMAAPTLGTLFGPVGTAVGAVVGSGVRLVANALGVEPTQEAITQAVVTDPAAAVKLREFELNNKLEIQRLSIQQEQMYLLDTQNARAMRGEHEKITQKSDYNLYILAWTIVVGFFVLMGVLLFNTLPPDTAGVLFMLFGALSAGFGQVLGFFFGSNKNSDNKTAMIYNSTPNTPKRDV